MKLKRSHHEDLLNPNPAKQRRVVGMDLLNDDCTSHSAGPTLVHKDYTIAWICALPLELANSRAMLDEEHRQLPTHDGDNNSYVLGRVGQHNVVMVCLPGQYGTNNAAIVATDLKRSFPRIRATLMVGIGGGSPSQADLYLGDVVVGVRVMQYDMGKVTRGGSFQGTADAKTPAPLLNSAVSLLRSNPDPGSLITSILQTRLPSVSRPNCLDRLFQATYEHPPGAPTCDGCAIEKLQLRKPRLSDEPKIHFGVIASGNLVMKNGKVRDEIAQRHNALCFEMEAAGMMDHLHCLPIRGICDYSDSHKSKEWQTYAAATAAAYSRELLKALPPLLKELDDGTVGFGEVSEPGTARNHTLERRQRLLECLSFSQIDARKATVEAAYAETCRWLLQHSEYQDWLNSEMQSQHHGFLWLRGKAGAGKSTMMKFLFSEMKRNRKKPNMATASFFFHARGDYLEKSIIGMYRSLLLQLLRAFPNLQSILDDTDIIPWGQQDCPDLNILKALLRNAVMALGQRIFTCFIDALDECDEQEARDMVHFFEELTEQTTRNGVEFRVCFSSRPYPYIDIRHGILLTLENEAGHADDLAQYVKNHLRITNSSLLEEIQTKILDKAGGIFMWIVLVVGILNKENSYGALALRRRISEIPAKLSDLFRSMLTRDQDRPEELLLCVLWVLCAKRPLSPAEFRHALWAGLLEQDLVDPDLPDDTETDAIRLVTSSSKGLAEITKSKEPRVQFIHQSVPDFLVKENGLQDMWPELGFDWEGPSHEKLRRCCATYLFLPDIQKLANRTRNEKELRAMAEKYPFLEYASQHVLCHANHAAPVVPQDQFVSRFLSSTGIRLMNFFERSRTRRYSTRAPPLYVLAERGLGNLIRAQMKKEHSIYAPGEMYEYPFFAALVNKHKDAIAALLGLSSTICDGVDIMDDLSYRKDSMRCKGRTPLSWAAQEGRLGIAKALAQAGEALDETDRDGNTPLLKAVQRGHEDVTKLLIEMGADVNILPKGKSTPLRLALKEGHAAIASLLVENGVDTSVPDRNGSTALMHDLSQEHWTLTRLLIEKGADVNAQNKSGLTALMHASKRGHGAAAILLIMNGASIDIKDALGLTALSHACKKGHENLARILIAKGADINTRDIEGSTPLMLATRGDGFLWTMPLLIQEGADLDAQNDRGFTAMMYATELGYLWPVELLIDNGADRNKRDEYGATALTYALRKGYDNMARLIEDGVRPRSALHYT